MKMNLYEIEDELNGNWWHYIRIQDFGFQEKCTDIGEFEVEDDDVLIHKEMVPNDRGQTFPQKVYHQVLDDATYIVSSKDIRVHMAEMLKKYINKHQKLPYATELKKMFKSGVLSFNYTPTDWDHFQLKIDYRDIEIGGDSAGKSMEEVENWVENLPKEEKNPLNPDEISKKDLSGRKMTDDDKLLLDLAQESVNQSVFVLKGKITDLEERTSQFQEHITKFYLLTIEAGEATSDPKNGQIHAFSKIYAKASENAKEKSELDIGMSVSFKGKVKKTREFGHILQNIRKFTPL